MNSNLPNSLCCQLRYQFHIMVKMIIKGRHFVWISIETYVFSEMMTTTTDHDTGYIMCITKLVKSKITKILNSEENSKRKAPYQMPKSNGQQLSYSWLGTDIFKWRKSIAWLERTYLRGFFFHWNKVHYNCWQHTSTKVPIGGAIWNVARLNKFVCALVQFVVCYLLPRQIDTDNKTGLVEYNLAGFISSRNGNNE